MKAVYIIVIIVSLITVTMLALSFFYLDQQRHQTFLYVLYHDNVPAGYEKVDRYVLESRTIYKSISELPRDILRRKTIRKIVFDIRGKDFVEYRKEILSNGAKSMVCISRSPEKISFIATGHANFSYLDKIPTYGNDIVFENMCAATYLPLIRRYNFKKRGEQFINVITPISRFLPPVRDIAAITSIGKDVIEIEGRRINCERLLLKLKSGDLISVWVTRTFRNLLMVHIPAYGFKAIFCTEKESIPVENYCRESDLYIEKEAIFTNEDVLLHGTLSVPTSGEGPYPAVLLIWNSGPLDKDALGIFTDIAHNLAEAGYCVLRFDKRGTGQSQGFFSTYAQPEEISDVKHAIDFLKSRSEVDESRIALLGHSEGGFYAAYLAGQDKEIRACIILSALSSLSPLEKDCLKLKHFINKIVPEDKEYHESAIAAITQSREIIKDKGDWITILNERVFTKKMGLENRYNPTENIKKVGVPVLILHGRKDDINFIEEAESLGKALAEAGNNNFTTIYFGELDHFFGITVKNPPTRNHIEIDAEVLKSIITWLDKNLVPPPPEPPPKDVETEEMQATEKTEEKEAGF